MKFAIITPTTGNPKLKLLLDSVRNLTINEHIEIEHIVVIDGPKFQEAATALLNATPYPGTELFQLARQHGFAPPASLEEWSNFKFEVSNIPWEDEGRKKQLRLLMFASYFLNKKVEEQTNNPLLKVASKLYTPIAEYRLKNFKTGFPIELSIASLFGF